MTVLKMDRDDVIDTSDMDMLMFHVPTGHARTHNAMPDELARLIGRLVMGQPVPREQLHAWGLVTMRLMKADDPAVAEMQRMGLEVITDISKVVPIKRVPASSVDTAPRSD